jgi:FkbM family methyltransferase
MRRIHDMAGRIVLRASPLILNLQKTPILRRFLHFAGELVLPANHRVWVDVRSGAAKGLRMKLNPRTQAGFYASAPDLALRDFLMEHLHPGMTFWDLGANQGVFSLVAAKLVGPTGRVLSLEPDPELAERLAEHAAANGCSNIQIIQAAAGAVDGPVNFDRGGVSGADFGQGKIVSYEESDLLAGHLSIRCVTLDSLLRRETPPHFIKCDVEGAEAEVFQAARELLNRHCPHIECEVHSSLIGETLVRFLQQSGYSLKWYAANHFLAVPASRS